MIFSGTTISGLDMLEGTYNYSIPNDNIILNIGQISTVPEPTSLALLGLGLAGFAGFGFSKKKKKA